VKRILVTGAGGFVGRVTCARLNERGFSARAVVRVNTSPPIAGAHDTFTVREISPTTDWQNAFESIETVVHLAARVHVIRDKAGDSLGEFRKVNVAGTERLAIQAAHAGVKRFVFVSSVKVNGEETQGKAFSEVDRPDPKDSYGISKWEAEQALVRVASQTGLEVVIMRPPLVYGPGVKGNFLTMLKVLRRRVALPLGSITNRRSLLYVENFVDALMLCASHPAGAGETFLVSDGEDVSTPELLRKLGDALDAPTRLLSVPLGVLRLGGRILGRAGALERLLGSLVVDSGKIRRDLGWAPPFSLNEGLQKTAEWFKRSRV
jgi:nucleoside-diphosphate-sugar epimerase